MLRAQDGLYTLVLANPDGSRDARVIGSIVDYRYAPEDWEGAIDVLAAPSTRIVSMTITEGGYSPDGPAFALLTEGLARRRERGVTSPTIVSCDNIEDNGNLARRTVLEAAARRDRGLADWIATHTRFPNSMVDRITRPRRLRSSRMCAAISASTTGGRCWPNRLPRGCSRTTSATAGHHWNRPVCCWSTTSARMRR
ncbi:NADP oxidoreductase [Mycobacterium xenopi 3993]|nr:NADP oxidoreductase [Mycobacterium xenopi 3993]